MRKNTNPQYGVHCNTCDTTIVSRHRHDYVLCECEPTGDPTTETWCFVDGGTDYLRYGAANAASFAVVEVPDLPRLAPDIAVSYVLTCNEEPSAEFHWNGSLTVNVYLDGIETDVFTLSEPTLDAAKQSVAAWVLEALDAS